MNLIIDNVAIPMYLDERFTILDLRNGLDYYPNYKQYGGTLSWGSYVSTLFKEIDKVRPSDYTADKANEELIMWLTPMGYLDRYEKIKHDGDLITVLKDIR